MVGLVLLAVVTVFKSVGVICKDLFLASSNEDLQNSMAFKTVTEELGLLDKIEECFAIAPTVSVSDDVL